MGKQRERINKEISGLQRREGLRGLAALGGIIGGGVAGAYVGLKLEKTGVPLALSIPSRWGLKQGIRSVFRRSPKVARSSSRAVGFPSGERIGRIEEITMGSGRRVRMAPYRVGPIPPHRPLAEVGVVAGYAGGVGVAGTVVARRDSRDAERVRKRLGVGGKPITPWRAGVVKGSARLAWRTRGVR